MKEQLVGYVPGNTLIHRIDPLSKLAWVFLVSAVAFVFDDPRVIAIQLAVVIVLCIIGRPPQAPLVRPLLLLAALAALLMVFQILNSHSGPVIARIGPISVHEDGWTRGVIYSLRVATLMLSSFLFVRTTDPRRLVVGLVRLHIPYRFAWMVFVSLTSMSTFRTELETAREAQLVRGLPASSSYFEQRFVLLKRYVQSMLVVGLRRVEVVSVAMDLRGFGASPTRTFIDPFAWSRVGIAAAIVWLAVLAYAVVERLL